MGKQIDSLAGDDIPLAERVNLFYMNTTVTRGRAEMVVTATRMNTELGLLAGMLGEAQESPTPLQQQLDHLGKTARADRRYRGRFYAVGRSVAWRTLGADGHDGHCIGSSRYSRRPARGGHSNPGNWSAAYGTQPGHRQTTGSGGDTWLHLGNMY